MPAADLLLTTLPPWRLALTIAPVASLLMAWLACQGWPGARWRLAQGASTLALTLAALALPVVLLAGPGQSLFWRADLLGAVVGVLVAGVGWVILRYSATYLDGEPRTGAYLSALLLALASVLTVVSSNHLLVLAAAWTVTSLAVHRLLNFYPQRLQARLAAHKKFVFARLADLAVWLACALLITSLGTAQLDVLLARVAGAPALPAAAQVAVALLVLAAMLKCAQLPFHGWLIQVMEAPTPVSALLHAGVVNLGGFVLIRLAPLVAQVPSAMTALVCVGTVTAVLAALVMSTRISIKVMLAWSTAAQMGFMLMQCGLGLWEMALLHLVAHSLYKAHAFLSAGGVVREAQVSTLAQPSAPLTPAAWWRATLAAVGLVALVVGVARMLSPGAVTPVMLLMAGVLALAWVPLLAGPGHWGRGALAVLALSTLYAALHGLLHPWVAPAASVAPSPALLVAVALAFAGLFWAQSLLRLRPQGRWAQRLYPWVYGGGFLDERLSRLLPRLRPAGPSTR
jgi:NAD(P)H-quinone oxidoreductase subunit 5